MRCDAESVRDGGALVQPLTPPGKPWSHCEDDRHLVKSVPPSLCSGAGIPFLDAVHRVIAGLDLTGLRCSVSAYPHHVCLDVYDR